MDTKDSSEELELAQPLRYFDVINFQELYRVKGHQGIHTCKVGTNKSGVCVMSPLSNPAKSVPVAACKCVCLVNYIINTEAGEPDFTVKGVLNNMHEKKESGEFVFEGKSNVVDLMSMVAPNYDEDKFKPSHLDRLWGWYIELEKYVKMYNDATISEEENKGIGDA